MMRSAKWIAVLITMLLLANCSSLPDIRKDKAQATVEGEILLKRSRQLAMQNRNEHAYQEATRAYEKFTLSDDVRGKVLTCLDLARLCRKLGKPDDSKAWQDKSHRLAVVFEPSLLPNWQLLKTEFFFAEARYDSVLSYTGVTDDTEGKEETVAHLTAYRILAGLQLPSYDQKSLKRDTDALAKQVSQLEDKYEDYKLDDPYVMSFAEYTLGYAATKQQSWIKAAAWFEKALAIDRQFGNYRGTADNLFGLGVSTERRQQPELAQGYFERARDIYYGIGDTLSAQRSAVKVVVIKYQGGKDQDDVIKEIKSLYLQVRDDKLKAELARFLRGEATYSKE